MKAVILEVKVFFLDFFEVKQEMLEKYAAFDISLINDIPLFINPFLLFNSKKKDYQEQHEGILKYLIFLKDKSAEHKLDKGLISAWYKFPELKQNWFGYSKTGNNGRGLGNDFAKSLHENLHMRDVLTLN